jgi:heptosyltransferase III
MGKSTMNSHTSSPTYLIVCFRFIGDVLVTTPLAFSIKTAHPNAEIDYLVFKGTEAILEKNPYVRRVFTIPRDSTGLRTLASLFRRYDFAIAAYPSDRTAIAAAIAGKYSIGLTNGWRKEWWKHIVLNMHYVCYDYLHVVHNMLMPLRVLDAEPKPKVIVGHDEADMQMAQSLVSGKPYLVLHPYSRNNCKYWPAEYWGKLAEMICDRTNCIPLFTITPAPSDRAYLNNIIANSHSKATALQASCNLNQLAAVICGSVAYVGIDTLVTHMAAALGTPTFAIFGPSWTRYWAPWPYGCKEISPFLYNKGIQKNGNVTVIQKDWECVPCNKEQCAIQAQKNCKCLANITPQEVLDEIMKTCFLNK